MSESKGVPVHKVMYILAILATAEVRNQVCRVGTVYIDPMDTDSPRQMVDAIESEGTNTVAFETRPKKHA